MKQITDELRSSPGSVAARIQHLEKIGLVEKRSLEAFRYHPKNPEVEQIVGELAEAYLIRRHKVLELIFSPMKRARKFADAFRVGKLNQSNGEDDG